MLTLPWAIQQRKNMILNKIQSAKICLNFNWGVSYSSENPKCQDLPKFKFEGRGCSVVVKTQSAKICLNFHFLGGGLFCTKSQNRVFLSIWSKNSASLDCLCITDSLSHTTYLETNKFVCFIKVTLVLFRNLPVFTMF